MPSMAPEIHALHRYFIWSSRMRDHFVESFEEGEHQEIRFPPSDHIDVRRFGYLSLWCSMLYVLVEGWKELRLSDQSVDALLIDDNLELLRRFRNGAFHFQREYLDGRFVAFLNKGEDILIWLAKLHQAFSQFFLRELHKAGFHWSISETADGSATINAKRDA
ncbi:MAG TPA: hypothetical protein VKG21_00010 [Casimicrobiaceae bacterium]|nr:hypothetical protein [Casimicrobiaceae bacterium]